MENYIAAVVAALMIMIAILTVSSRVAEVTEAIDRNTAAIAQLAKAKP